MPCRKRCGENTAARFCTCPGDAAPTAGGLFDISNVVRETLAKPLADYLIAHPGATPQQIINALQSFSSSSGQANADVEPSSVTLDPIAGGNGYRLRLVGTTSRNVKIDLGSTSTGDVTLTGNTDATLTCKLSIDMTFGLVNDDFAIRFHNVSIDVDAIANNLIGTAQVGIVGASISGGSLLLDSSINFAATGTSLSSSAIAGCASADSFLVTTAGSLNGNLPVTFRSAHLRRLAVRLGTCHQEICLATILRCH